MINIKIVIITYTLIVLMIGSLIGYMVAVILGITRKERW